MDEKIKKVISICPYCGCGCKLKYIIKNKKISGVEAVSDSVSEGKPCVKGLTSHEPIYTERLISPMIRNDKNEKFKEVNWEEVYSFIKKKIGNLKPSEIYFTGSGEFTNEDNFVLQKFARVVFKTNNIDCCARLCHAPTTYATTKCFGLNAIPYVMDDILNSDLIIAIGTNPFSNYPVFFNRILKAKKNGAKLITVGAQNFTSKYADIHLDIEYGTLIILLAGLINEVIKSGKYEYYEGFDELKKSVESIRSEDVADICKINIDDFKKVARALIESKNLAITHGMGLTQHENGTQHAIAVCNLLILKNGKLINLRGKINVQGASDMMCCPGGIPFGGSIDEAKRIWGYPVPTREGKKLTEILLDDEIKAIYVLGMNPAQSLPDLNRIHKKLANIFVIYQHHHPGMTMKFANVVLPAPLLIESEGTITNGERRVRYVRKVVDPLAGKQNWQIICELAKTFGYEKQFAYKSSAEIFDEITKAIPDYAMLDWKKIKNGKNEFFANKMIEFKKIQPIRLLLPAMKRSEEYPFFLTTSRWYHHFCTGELTTRSQNLIASAPKAVVHVNKIDAKNLGVENGDIVRVSSESGSIEIEANIDPFIKQRVIRIPFHFEDTLVNKLMSSEQLDKETKTPNYKVIKVKIEKIEKLK